jgi:hypothetical protein
VLLHHRLPVSVLAAALVAGEGVQYRTLTDSALAISVGPDLVRSDTRRRRVATALP